MIMKIFFFRDIVSLNLCTIYDLSLFGFSLTTLELLSEICVAYLTIQDFLNSNH